MVFECSFFINIAASLTEDFAPLDKNILLLLELTTAADAFDAGIRKQVHGSCLHD